MVKQYVLIGIVVGVFFVGLAGVYAIFLNAYQPNVMMTQTEPMQKMMMGSSPVEEHEMMLAIIESMTEDENLMNHMFAHMMEDDKVVHKMLTIMSKTPHMKDHMAAHVSGDLSEYAYLDEEEHEEHGHKDEH